MEQITVRCSEVSLRMNSISTRAAWLSRPADLHDGACENLILELPRSKDPEVHYHA